MVTESNNEIPMLSDNLHLYFHKTDDYPCSYLANRQAGSLVALPVQEADEESYCELIRHGFRRSGLIIYRPDCVSCQECIPVRVLVNDFYPNRTQRRTLKNIGDVSFRELPLAFIEEHYALYQRYQKGRHSNGGMDQDDEEQYSKFILQSNVESRLIEFSENGKIKLVCLIDVVEDGISSVYTFFDPDEAQKSWGTFCILWQIAQCQVNKLPYLYLGYWIKNSPKMTYKANFQPLEGFINGTWQALQTK